MKDAVVKQKLNPSGTVTTSVLPLSVSLLRSDTESGKKAFLWCPRQRLQILRSSLPCLGSSNVMHYQKTCWWFEATAIKAKESQGLWHRGGEAVRYFTNSASIFLPPLQGQTTEVHALTLTQITDWFPQLNQDSPEISRLWHDCNEDH